MVECLVIRTFSVTCIHTICLIYVRQKNSRPHKLCIELDNLCILAHLCLLLLDNVFMRVHHYPTVHWKYTESHYGLEFAKMLSLL